MALLSELVQSGSVSVFMGASGGLHSHTLLLDEEKGRLLLGARDHVYLLDPDNLSRAPRKVSYPASQSVTVLNMRQKEGYHCDYDCSCSVKGGRVFIYTWRCLDKSQDPLHPRQKGNMQEESGAEYSVDHNIHTRTIITPILRQPDACSESLETSARPHTVLCKHVLIT